MIVGGSERMKGLELNVTKQNGMTFVEYHLGAADAYDDRVSDKVAQLGNIIPFQYKDEDGKRSIVSYVHNDNTLEVTLKRTLKKAEALAVIKGLLCAFEIGAAGVQISYLVRDAKYIYVDPESFAVKCIMVPVKQDALGQSDIPDFFRNIVAHMRFDDADSDNYVARILTLINTDHYSNMKLKELVDAEMEKIGVFYTRDEGIRTGLDTHAAPDVNKDVKVNRVGVMNNMRPQMGQPGMPPMGQPGMPQMPKPEMPKPQAPQMPKPEMPKPEMPKPQAPQMPKPEMPKPQAPQMGQPQMPNGGLMGQLGGARPIPHLIRKKTGEIINITKPEFVIGKSKTKADYAIENNSAISREHCTVIQRDGVNYIKDDNSTNHTYVNGVELQPGKEVLLKHKTEIRMGDEEFTFLLRKGE